MSFFDDIEDDLIIHDTSTVMENLYGIYHLCDVYTPHDMLNYILTISHIEELISSIKHDINYNECELMLQKINIEQYIDNCYTYNKFIERTTSPRYIIIPKNKKDIRLLIEFYEQYIVFRYYKMGYWKTITIVDYNRDKDKFITNIKSSLLNEFCIVNDITSFQNLYT